MNAHQKPKPVTKLCFSELVLRRLRVATSDLHLSRWFGHVLRMPSERLPNKLLQWKLTYGKGSRGRPSKSYLDRVKEYYYIASRYNFIVKELVAATERDSESVYQRPATRMMGETASSTRKYICMYTIRIMI